jgi:hypothetical protein
MTFTLTINMDNAAFDGAPRYEIARLLNTVQAAVSYPGRVDGKVLDVNGNTVGRWEITE